MATYGAASGYGSKVIGDDAAVVDKSAKSQAEKAARAAARTARRRAGNASAKPAKPSGWQGEGAIERLEVKPSSRYISAEETTALGQKAKSNRNRNIALAATGATAAGGGAYALSRRGRKAETSKGLGVMPTLARRAPAAGRGARRIVTGDKVNARRVIGKGDEVSKLSFGAFKTGFSGGLAGMSKPKIPAAMLGQQKSAIAGNRLGQGALWAKSNKRLAGGVLGTSALAGAGVNSAFGKALNPAQAKRLAAVKGKRALGPEGVRERRAIYSRVGIGSKQNRVEMNPKGDWSVSDGMPRATRRRGYTYDDVERAMRKKPTTGSTGGVFGKRRFDPEDERRHRQGALSGLAAAGGVGALGNAGRLANRDRKLLKDSLPTGADLKLLAPGPLVGGPKRAKADTDAAHQQKQALHINRHSDKQRAHNTATRQMKNAEKLRGRKLLPVGGRSAAYGGAGIALVGTAAGLHRNRNEERWD